VPKLIYLDMDGVLFDLHSALRTYTGIDFPMEDRNKLFKSYLPDFVDANGFANIPPLPNAHELVQSVLAMNCHVAILTSGGSFHKSRGEVARQKKESIDNNFPMLESAAFCITSSGAAKAQLANKKTLLIDDHLPNIEKFKEAGGYAIEYHFMEYKSVIWQTRRFVNA